MQNLQLSLNFTGTAEEEVSKLVKEIRLIPLIQAIKKYDSELPQEVSENLSVLIGTIAEMFSTSLPDISKNPEETLRTISRDINLSRLLRERGLFRLYRFITHQVSIDIMNGNIMDAKDEESNPDFAANVPLYMVMENPNTGSRFTTQEEFIGWFCEEAHVSRSLVFMRIATINKMLKLSFDLESAFNIITKKPSIIREMLNMVGEWENNELIGIEPDIARQLAEHRSPELMEQVNDIIDRDSENVQEELANIMKPTIMDLVKEVALHDRAQGALDFVKYDILGEPEISYHWDTDLDTLMIHYINKVLDENGNEYVVSTHKIALIPDIKEILPDAVKQDLIRRLPIKNRNSIDK